MSSDSNLLCSVPNRLSTLIDISFSLRVSRERVDGGVSVLMADLLGEGVFARLGLWGWLGAVRLSNSLKQI